MMADERFESVLDPGQPALAGPEILSSHLSLRWDFFRLLASMTLRVLFGWRIEGRKNLPPGPCVIIANHLNWLDSFAVLMALPSRPKVYLLGWADVLDTRKLSWLIRKSGVGFIPVERDQSAFPAATLVAWRRMQRCLAEGAVLALYPEGTVGHDEGKLLPFHSGFARVALAAAVPVVPVALSGTRELWFRKRILVRIGRPLDPDGQTNDSLVESSRAALQRLLPVYRPARGPKLGRGRLTRLIPALTDTQADADR